MRLNLLRGCLSKDASKKTLNIPIPLFGVGEGVSVCRQAWLVSTPSPTLLACGLPGLRLEWEQSETEPGTLQVSGMLAHPFRPTASAGDPGWPLHSGRAGNWIKAFPWLGSLCRLPGTAQEKG